MDPLMPVLSILDTSFPKDRQQCVLGMTKEAKDFLKAHARDRETVDSRLRDSDKAYKEALKKCQIVTPSPTEAQVLGQLVMTFGKYTSKSFKWLVENDVGYCKHIVDRHMKEMRHPEKRKTINDEWLKEQLVKYAHLFTTVSCYLEVNVDRAIYGQGRFKSFTYLEMWQWYSLHKRLLADPQAGSDAERKRAQEAYTSVTQWLIMKEDDINSKALKRFRKYILDKEGVATPSTASASSSKPPAASAAAAPTATTSKAPPSPPPPAPPSITSKARPSATPTSTTKPPSAPAAAAASPTTTAKPKKKASSKSAAPAARAAVPTSSPVPSFFAPRPSATTASSADPSWEDDALLVEALSTYETQESQSQEAVGGEDAILFEGWHKSWEAEDSGLPEQDIKWLKEDEERGLFLKPRPFSDMYGRKRWRKVLKSEKMWFHPPEMPGVVDGSTVPVADSFFRHRVFFWRPVGVWRYSVRCTEPGCPAKDNPKAFLYRCGYGNKVRPICDINGW